MTTNEPLEIAPTATSGEGGEHIWHRECATLYTLKEKPGHYRDGRPVMVNDHWFVVYGPSADAVAGQIHAALSAPGSAGLGETSGQDLYTRYQAEHKATYPTADFSDWGEIHPSLQAVWDRIATPTTVQPNTGETGDGWQPIAELKPQTNAVLGRWARCGDNQDGSEFWYWQEATGRWYEHLGETHWSLRDGRFDHGPFYGETPTHFHAIPEKPARFATPATKAETPGPAEGAR